MRRRRNAMASAAEMTGAEPRVRCRGCSSDRLADLGQLPDRHLFAGVELAEPLSGGRLFRCRQCHLVFRDPILDAAAYGALYAAADADVWDAKRPVLRTDQSLAKAYIESNITAGASVLDIGCYTGDFLLALDAGYRKFGIEKSERAAHRCAEAGIAIIGDDLYRTDGLRERFDVVVAMDVIEHTVDPSRFIAGMLNLLADDGTILLTTGDAANAIWRKTGSAFWYCMYAEHISFIGEDWLALDRHRHAYDIHQLRRFRYERTPLPKLLAKRLLVELAAIMAARPRASWTAHISDDHLLVAIKRNRAIAARPPGNLPSSS